MNVWGFANGNIMVYQTLKIYRPIKDVCFDLENMLISFETRDAELFTFENDCKFSLHNFKI